MVEKIFEILEIFFRFSILFRNPFQFLFLPFLLFPVRFQQFQILELVE